MSFLQDDDPLATLEVALAFIDACADQPTQASAHSSNGHAETDNVSSLPAALTLSPCEPDASLKRARLTSRARSVQKYRESQKKELLTLREQVLCLEARLARLQRSGGSLTDSTPPQQLLEVPFAKRSKTESADARELAGLQLLLRPRSDLSWRQIAELRESERVHAEALNSKLRSALRRQRTAMKTLGVAVDKSSSVGRELLLDHQHYETIEERLSASVGEPASVARLQAELQQMHLMANAVVLSSNRIHTQDEWNRFAASSIHMEAIESGMRAEVRSTTLVRCAFQEAGEAMWKGSLALFKITMQTNLPTIEKRKISSASSVKSFHLSIDGLDQSPAALEGMALTHRFDEPDRFALMWTSTMAISNLGLAFVERDWIVATPSFNVAEQGHPPSIVKTFYEVTCHWQGQHVAGNGSQAQETAAFVLKQLSRRTRDFNQRMQDLLLDTYGPT